MEGSWCHFVTSLLASLLPVLLGKMLLSHFFMLLSHKMLLSFLSLPVGCWCFGKRLPPYFVVMLPVGKTSWKTSSFYRCTFGVLAFSDTKGQANSPSVSFVMFVHQLVRYQISVLLPHQCSATVSLKTK